MCKGVACAPRPKITPHPTPVHPSCDATRVN